MRCGPVRQYIQAEQGQSYLTPGSLTAEKGSDMNTPIPSCVVPRPTVHESAIVEAASRRFLADTEAARRRSYGRAPAGFTLVEMLVVITIIAILAGLVVTGALVARKRAKIGAIVTEISQFDAALRAYKEKFGEYPPDGTDQNAILRHIHKAFPRYDTAKGVPQIGAPGTGSLTPFNSLTFWLGGRWDDVNKRFTGFSADPTNPFDLGVTPSVSRIGPFLELDPNQCGDGGTVTFTPASGTTTTPMYAFRYWPKEAVNEAKTYGALVYFRADNGNYDTAKTWSDNTNNFYADKPRPDGVYAWVYPARDTRITSRPWINPKLFQIFSSGLGLQYDSPTDRGTPGFVGLLFPSGDNYGRQTYDDITNFNSGTLEDAKP
jgi:prepilin-type N-terminal cleavage/methylation domain-containing protein